MKRKLALLSICAVLMTAVVSWAEAKLNTLYYEVTLKSESFGNMGTRKLWVKDGNFRWEQKSGNLPVKVVKNDQGLFVFHPWKKIAAKYSKDSDRAKPAMLLPGPSGPVKAFLKSVKAIKQGSEKVNGVRCDVYGYTEPTTKRNCKLWVSPKTVKPTKLLMKGVSKKRDGIVVTYVKFQEGLRVSDALFKLPADYVIRPMPDKKTVNTKKTK